MRNPLRAADVVISFQPVFLISADQTASFNYCSSVRSTSKSTNMRTSRNRTFVSRSRFTEEGLFSDKPGFQRVILIGLAAIGF